MDQLAIARRAIEDEISALSAEVARLEKVLETLGGTDSIAPYAKYTSSSVATPKAAPAAPAITPPRRGRPPRSAAVAAPAKASGDIGSALEMIQSAGKKGLKALSLASLIKKAGGSRPSKEELLATDKIKMSGKGGGTTYTYIG